jgi:YegS/Rv2252/BmrU family lipid kinase
VRACIVDNPWSHRGPYPLHAVRPILAAAGWEVRVVSREPGCDIRVQVRDALDSGAEVVVAAGGDGTLRDVGSTLAGTGIPLGVLPGGTANLWAHEVGIPLDPRGAVAALVDSVARSMDVGRLALADGRGARFLLMAGIGADSRMLARTDLRLQRRLGVGGTALGVLRALPDLRPFQLAVTVDGAAAWEGWAFQVLAGNTRRYANVVDVTPAAFADDGLLDISIIPALPASAVGRVGWTLARERRLASAHVPALRGREVEVAVADPQPAELDGTLVSSRSIRAGGMPFRLTVEPAALRMLVPRGYRGGLFRGA